MKTCKYTALTFASVQNKRILRAFARNSSRVQFEGKLGQVIAAPSFGFANSSSVLVAGISNMEERKHFESRQAREHGTKNGLPMLPFSVQSWVKSALAVLTRFAAGNFRFDKYKAKGKRTAGVKTRSRGKCWPSNRKQSKSTDQRKNFCRSGQWTSC